MLEFCIIISYRRKDDWNISNTRSSSTSFSQNLPTSKINIMLQHVITTASSKPVHHIYSLHVFIMESYYHGVLKKVYQPILTVEICRHRISIVLHQNIPTQKSNFQSYHVYSSIFKIVQYFRRISSMRIDFGK